VIQGDGICRHSSCRLLTKPPLVTISVCGTDLPPLQGYNRWGELPRLKPGAKLPRPFGPTRRPGPTRRHAGSAGNFGSQPLATCNFDACDHSPVDAKLGSSSTGSFCWAELEPAISLEQSVSITRLFAWTANDVPIGPNDFYTMFQLRGRDVAAAYTLRPRSKRAGSTAPLDALCCDGHADSTSEKAAQLGGKVLASPFDVFDVGRMPLFRIRPGAVFAIWQAKRHHGTGVASEDRTFFGPISLPPIPKRPQNFTRNFLGWETEASKNDPAGYLHILNQAITSAEFRRYKKVRELPTGSSTIRFLESSPWQSTQSPMGGRPISLHLQWPDTGKIAVLADPQGAVFGLFEPLARG